MSLTRTVNAAALLRFNGDLASSSDAGDPGVGGVNCGCCDKASDCCDSSNPSLTFLSSSQSILSEESNSVDARTIAGVRNEICSSSGSDLTLICDSLIGVVSSESAGTFALASSFLPLLRLDCARCKFQATKIRDNCKCKELSAG